MYAHPDDESFSAGTPIALAAAGHETALLTLTRGDAGLWFGKPAGSWDPDELAAERAREWEAAARVIGYARSRLLRWPDGGLADAPADVVTADIVAAIREWRPELVFTFGPEGAGSEHDDHRACSYLTARAFARAAIPDEFPERGTPHAARRLFFGAVPHDPAAPLPFGAPTPTHVLDVSASRERKAAAFECHRTQFKDRDFFYELLERRGGRESFHLAIDRTGATPASADLFR